MFDENGALNVKGGGILLGVFLTLGLAAAYMFQASIFVSPGKNHDPAPGEYESVVGDMIKRDANEVRIREVMGRVNAIRRNINEVILRTQAYDKKILKYFIDRKSSRENIHLVMRQLMLSQRIFDNVNYMLISEDAGKIIRKIAEDTDEYGAILGGMVRGNESMPMVKNEKVQGELFETSMLFSIVADNVKKVLDLSDDIIFVQSYQYAVMKTIRNGADLTDTMMVLDELDRVINALVPKLQSYDEEVAYLLIGRKYNRSIIYMASLQEILSQRFVTNINQALRGKDVDRAIERLFSDTEEYGTVLDGMVRGNETVSMINDNEVQARLFETAMLFTIVADYVEELRENPSYLLAMKLASKDDVAATENSEIKVNDKDSAMESGRDMVREIKSLSRYFGDNRYITFRTVTYPNKDELQYDVARVYRDRVEFIANPNHPGYEGNKASGLQVIKIQFADSNNLCFGLDQITGKGGKEYASIPEAIRKEDGLLVVQEGSMCAYNDQLVLRVKIYGEELGKMAEEERKYSNCRKGRYGGCNGAGSVQEYVIERDKSSTHIRFNAEEIAKIKKQIEWGRLFSYGSMDFNNNRALLRDMIRVKKKCSDNGYRGCVVICDEHINSLHKAGSFMSTDTREDYWGACVTAAARGAGVDMSQ